MSGGESNIWATQAACADDVLAAGNKLLLVNKELSTRDVTFLVAALVDPQVIATQTRLSLCFKPLMHV
jgi:hypothetical protein